MTTTTTTITPPRTTLTRSTRRWIAGGVLVAIAIAGVLVATRGGGPLDADDASGFSGLRLLLERRGATVSDVDADAIDATAVRDYDVAFVMNPADVSAAQAADWYDFVHAGGRLVLGRPERGSGDPATGAPIPVHRGECTMDHLDGIDEVYVRKGANRHAVNRDERSCFGTLKTAQITAAACGTGEKVTLSDVSMFDNETMGAPTDDRNHVDVRSNSSVAAAVFETGVATRVAIVTGDVPRSLGLDDATARRSKCVQNSPGGSFDSDAPAARSTGRPGAGASNRPGPDGGDNADGATRYPGEPQDPATTSAGGQGSGERPDHTTRGGSGERPNENVGAGQNTAPGEAGSGQNSPGQKGSGKNGQRGEGSGQRRSAPGLLDLLPAGILLALAQLIAATLWYVLRRSRRDTVVAEEGVPVTVGSSRVVEATGALRRRSGDVARSGEDLRRRTREQLNQAFGFPRGTDPGVLARRIEARTGRSADATLAVLAGDHIRSDDELLALSHALDDLRLMALQVPAGPGGG